MPHIFEDKDKNRLLDSGPATPPGPSGRSIGDLLDTREVPTQLALLPYNVPDDFYDKLDELIKITSSDSQQRAKVIAAVKRLLNPPPLVPIPIPIPTTR